MNKEDLEREAEQKDELPVYALDPFYGPRLSRIDVIFSQLSVETEGCRQQVNKVYFNYHLIVFIIYFYYYLI